MFGVIGTILASALPLLVKLINYIIDKKSKSDELKEAMLKLIVLIGEENVSVKIHDKYEAQLDRLREQLRRERNERTKPVDPQEF